MSNPHRSPRRAATLLASSGLIAVIALVATSCSRNTGDERAAAAATSTATNPADAQLLAALRGYRKPEHRVQYMPDWVLTVCDQSALDHALKEAKPVSRATLSKRDDERDHGQKIAFFYASPLNRYTALSAYPRTNDLATNTAPPSPEPLPEEMLIVKEAWAAELISIADVPPRHRADSETYVVEGNRAWKRGERTKLFAMYKPPTGTPLAAETDHGWVYAILTPSGDRILERGVIARCADCHATVPVANERLFGPRP